MYASKRLQGFVNVPRTWPQTQVRNSAVEFKLAEGGNRIYIDAIPRPTLHPHGVCPAMQSSLNHDEKTLLDISQRVAHVRRLVWSGVPVVDGPYRSRHAAGMRAFYSPM